MTYPTDRPATWFVTGTSRGLGLELVRLLLARGDRVAATTRSVDRLTASLDSPATTSLLPLEVDLTAPEDVEAAVARTVGTFGGLDVVVNNAGYGYLGAVEETPAEDVRTMFDVQVHGTWNVLRSVLPPMRAAGSGHVVNVSSVLGLLPFPGWGLYVAAKHALEGLTGSLAAEVAGFGIRVNLVEPGYMRTDFLTPHSLALPGTTVEGYQAVREMTRAHQAMPGTQLGDPARAAAAIVRVVERGDAPLHQLLGSDTLGLVEGRLDALRAELEASRTLAVTTDVPA